MSKNLKIGFIGQGFIGKNYANDFEERGYDIVRYDLDDYKDNKDKIKDCDIVLVSVPTPTTPEGFDDSIVEAVLPLVGKGNIAVIKSTLQVGTTRKMQKLFPDITVMHSPEFLREKTAPADARCPERNIVGILDVDDKELYKKGETVMSVLAEAPYTLITSAENAEMIKYGGNCFLYFKVIFANILYDLTQKHNLDYDAISDAMSNDFRIGKSHLDVVDKGGRGAGGHCFIKDFEAMIEMLHHVDLHDQEETMLAIRNLNLKYLKASNKDLDLVKEIYEKENLHPEE